jgi:hypothetical protein
VRDLPIRKPKQRVYTGLRRVTWVRVTIEEHSIRAEAIGIGYRLPRVVPISLRNAAQLIAEGTPLVVRRPEVGQAA